MLKKANIFSIISSGKSSKEVEGIIADNFRRFALVSIFSFPPEVARKKMKKYVRHYIFNHILTKKYLTFSIFSHIYYQGNQIVQIGTIIVN